MTTKEPCGNEECDACYPLPRWKVSTVTVRRIKHEREVKAATPEEAVKIYEQGTEWPSSYDEHTLETLETEPTVARRVTDEFHLDYHRTETCFHNILRRSPDE